MTDVPYGPKERSLRRGSPPVGEEVGDLGHHEQGNDQGTRSVGQELDASRVVAIACRGGGDERTGIDDQHIHSRSRERLRTAAAT